MKGFPEKLKAWTAAAISKTLGCSLGLAYAWKRGTRQPRGWVQQMVIEEMATVTPDVVEKADSKTRRRRYNRTYYEKTRNRRAAERRAWLVANREGLRAERAALHAEVRASCHELKKQVMEAARVRKQKDIMRVRAWAVASRQLDEAIHFASTINNLNKLAKKQT